MMRGGGQRPDRVVQNNNLSLNVIKTMEMIVDYRKRRNEHAPILIDGAVVEQVESFTNITNKLTWSRQNLLPLRKLKRFGMGPQILKNF